MAIKFIDELPPANRGRGATGSRAVSEDTVEALKDNPGKWALVKENTTTAQSIYKWTKENPGFECTTRSSGKETKNMKNIMVPGIDIYMRFNPDGKKD